MLTSQWYHNLGNIQQIINKGKPIKCRYKLWCPYTNLSYLIQCDPYSGKGHHNAKVGLEGSVVARLVNKLPSEFSFKLTLDNLCTSLALLNHLSENESMAQAH